MDIFLRSQLGGLGLSPAAIGVYMGIFSFLNGASQLLIFPRIVRRIGIKMTLYFSMGSFIPIFLWFPIMNKIARLNGMSMPVWTSMAAHLALLGLMDMSYPIIFVYITASAPNKVSHFSDGWWIQHTKRQSGGSIHMVP